MKEGAFSAGVSLTKRRISNRVFIGFYWAKMLTAGRPLHCCRAFGQCLHYSCAQTLSSSGTNDSLPV